MKKQHLAALATAVGVVLAWAGTGAAQAPPTPDQMVAALKQNLAESQKRLRQYEWVETTSISLKGEEKSRKQQRAYYGADGKLAKVPLGDPAPQAQQGGGRGRGSGRMKERIVENKKDEMTDYMERAAALIEQYVPPSPENIQKAKDAGKWRFVHQSRGRFASSSPTSCSHRTCWPSTWTPRRCSERDQRSDLSRKEGRHGHARTFVSARLTDGTSYTAQTTLEAKAKNITVVIQNSGHRPLAR